MTLASGFIDFFSFVFFWKERRKQQTSGKMEGSLIAFAFWGERFVCGKIYIYIYVKVQLENAFFAGGLGLGEGCGITFLSFSVFYCGKGER